MSDLKLVKTWCDLQNQAALFNDGHRLVLSENYEVLLSESGKVVGWWASGEGDYDNPHFAALEDYIDDNYLVDEEDEPPMLTFTREQRQAIKEARQDVPPSLKRLTGLLV